MKKLRPRLSLSLFLLLLTPGVSAARQEAAPVQEALPEARAVIDRFAEVTHQKELVAKTRSVHQTGQVKMSMGLEGPLEVWAAKPARRLSISTLGEAGEIKIGFDGETGWMNYAMLGGARLLEGADLLPVSLESRYDAGLKPAEAYESLRTVGRENFEGKDCYKVEVVARPLADMDAEKTLKSRTTFEFYEVASGLLIGAKGFYEGEFGSSPFTVVQSDWKDFGGYLWPTRTVNRQGPVELTSLLTAVEYDTVDEGVFQLPPDVQALKQAAKPAEKAPAKAE